MTTSASDILLLVVFAPIIVAVYLLVIGLAVVFWRDFWKGNL